MNLDYPTSQSKLIRKLNDAFRRSFVGGVVFVTPGIQVLGISAQIAIVRAVREFDQFDEGNDPFHEHDFGAIDHSDAKIFFKIDYYDRNMQSGSPDPSDPVGTTRVLTIMTAQEY